MSHASTRDVEAIDRACTLVLETAQRVELDDDYFYASLPLCVIDAVFSIGVRYGSVRNVVERYCRQYGLIKLAARASYPPSSADQESITTFVERLDGMEPEQIAEIVFGNRQRTSPRSGILKSQAVLEFARVLARHKIAYLQDALTLPIRGSVEKQVRLIAGQGSGLSWSYFLMLAGREDIVKADRMVLGFFQRALGRTVGIEEAQSLLVEACGRLRSSYPSLTPRLLDNLIWKSESGRAATISADCRQP